MIQSAARMTLRPVRHIAVGIRRSYAEVYAFLAQPENFPKWASGLGHSFHHRAGFEWVAETPLGIMAIRFSEPNEFGVLDHWLLPETGAPMHNPCARSLPGMVRRWCSRSFSAQSFRTRNLRGMPNGSPKTLRR
jgi:hypothetical protein